MSVSSGDTAWLLVSSALVMLMTPGLALFYGGMVRRKNVLSTIMMSFIALGLIGLLWVLYGYSLSFSPGGGGFIGGLLTAGGLVIYALAHGPKAVRHLIRIDPRSIIGAGLFAALAATLAGPLCRRPVLSGLWAKESLPGIGKVSTVLLFDVGVHLTVVGSVVLILVCLAEERS